MKNLTTILFIGIGATAIMDLWGILRLQLFGLAPADYGLVGRWLAYMRHGQFRHDSIAAVTPVKGERLLGWTAHYLIGVFFAALLICFQGMDWLLQPTIVPALTLGIATLTAPFLLMQPGMGAGIAASRTQHPNRARLQSLVTHLIFGLGLYLTAWLMRTIS